MSAIVPEQDHDAHRVYSPEFNEYFAVSDNERKVPAHCPIDGTQLISIVTYDVDWYECHACHAHYGNISPEELTKTARRYATETYNNLLDLKKNISRLEKTLNMAEKNHLLDLSEETVVGNQ